MGSQNDPPTSGKLWQLSPSTSQPLLWNNQRWAWDWCLLNRVLKSRQSLQLYTQTNGFSVSYESLCHIRLGQGSGVNSYASHQVISPSLLNTTGGQLVCITPSHFTIFAQHHGGLEHFNKGLTVLLVLTYPNGIQRRWCGLQINEKWC